MKRAKALYSSTLLLIHSPQAYHSLLRGRSAYTVGVVVEHGVLNHGSEDEHEADGDKQVHGGYVGHSGNGVSGHCAQGGHGQHCGDSCEKEEKREVGKGRRFATTAR